MAEREVNRTATSPSLDEAVAAARAGRRDDAAHALRRIVADDPFNVDAWVWLGGVATEAREQRSALEHALAVAPDDRRAQNGLTWLRQTHPEVFQDDLASPGSVEAGAGTEDDVPDEDETQPLPSSDDLRSEHRSSIYDAPTQAMHVPTRAAADRPFEGDQSRTQEMRALGPASVRLKPAVSDQRTDRMAVAPPRPARGEEHEVEERYGRGADVARWLLIFLYLVSLGAAAFAAAFSLYDPDGYTGMVDSQLAPWGLRLTPSFLATTYWVSVAILVGAAVFDLIMVLGFLFRKRWAWVINLIVATLALVGAVALLLPDVTFPASVIGPLVYSNPIVQILGGLTLFSLIFFLLSLASYRAFFPRRVVDDYGR